MKVEAQNDFEDRLAKLQAQTRQLLTGPTIERKLLIAEAEAELAYCQAVIRNARLES